MTFSQSKYSVDIPDTLVLGDISRFISLLEEKPFQDSSFRLSLDMFHEAYRQQTQAINLVLLISCLESISNLGRDQIRHTASRHAALITSSTKEEFDKNYQKLKKSYDERSRVVHSGKMDINLQLLNSLGKVVRFSLAYWNENRMSKDELWKRCNSPNFCFNRSSLINWETENSA